MTRSARLAVSLACACLALAAPGRAGAQVKPVQRMYAAPQKTAAFTKACDIEVRCLDFFRAVPRSSASGRPDHLQLFHGSAFVSVGEGKRLRALPLADALRVGWLRLVGKSPDGKQGPWRQLTFEAVRPGAYRVELVSPCLFWAPPADPKKRKDEAKDFGELFSLYQSRLGVIRALDADHERLLEAALFAVVVDLFETQKEHQKLKRLKGLSREQRRKVVELWKANPGLVSLAEKKIDYLYWSLWNNRPKDFDRFIERWRVTSSEKLEDELRKWRDAPPPPARAEVQARDGTRFSIDGVSAEQLSELQESLAAGGLRYLRFADEPTAELRLSGEGLLVPRRPSAATLAEAGNIARWFRDCPAALRGRMREMAQSWPRVSAAALDNARQILQAPLLGVRFQDGQAFLRHPDGAIPELPLSEVANGLSELPAAWRNLPGPGPWLVNLSGLTAGQTRDVFQLLRGPDSLEGVVRAQIHCVNGPEEERRWQLARPPEPGRMVFQAHASLANAFADKKAGKGGKDGDGALMVRALGELADRGLPQGNVHVLFGHDDGNPQGPNNPVAQWIQDARNGRFEGGRVLIVACHASPDLIQRFIREARAHGASSVVVSTQALNGDAAVFAAAVLARLERIPDGRTWRGVWEDCFAEAAARLTRCNTSADVEREFGPTLAGYLVLGGRLSTARRDALAEKLRANSTRFIWVAEGRPSLRHARDRGPSA
jgi:hypothetical protein